MTEFLFIVVIGLLILAIGEIQKVYNLIVRINNRYVEKEKGE